MRDRVRPASFAALLATLAGGVALAAAQPGGGRPVPPLDAPAFAPAPRALEVVSGDATVTAQLESRTDGIVACARKATFVRARVRLAWNRRGNVRSVSVSGGTAAFNRCAGTLLRGGLAAPVAGAGRGRAELIVLPGSYTRPTPVRPPPPPPAPPQKVTGKVDIHACQVDSDCVVHFRLDACFPGDPIGVNTLDPAAVRLAYPVTRHECGMGGPQWEDRMLADQHRYSVTCEQRRCVAHDAGAQPTRPGPSVRAPR